MSVLISQNTRMDNKEFISGADVSFLQQVEDNGGVFTENGVMKNALQILRNHGVNYIRLRLWHTPEGWYNGLDKTLAMALRIKQYGFKFLLDFHFSQTWADPGHQEKPPEWQSLSFNLLRDSIYSYTIDVLTALKVQNTPPDMIQLGNEVTCGMLWPDGRVCDSDDTPAQWQKFADLMNAAIQGVHDALDSSGATRIMIHIDRGADSSGGRWFFDHLTQQGVNFDLIGLSYYPWWHGELALVKPTMNALANRYGKDIVIVETAYPWTLTWDDATTNQVGSQNQLLAGYPATVDGQKMFLDSLRAIIGSVDSGRGGGFFYWSPERITTAGFGSDWENNALFDFHGEVLSSIQAFETAQTEIRAGGISAPAKFRLIQNFPNPFNPTTTIEFTLPKASTITLNVYNILGELVRPLVNARYSPGTYDINFDALHYPGGVYFYTIATEGFIQTGKMVVMK